MQNKNKYRHSTYVGPQRDTATPLMPNHIPYRCWEGENRQTLSNLLGAHSQTSLRSKVFGLNSPTFPTFKSCKAEAF